jgi:hypothetical protein
MSKKNKKIVKWILFIAITCLALNCTTSDYYPVNKITYSNADSSVKKICDSIGVDFNTIGTTTDPEN